MMGQLPTDQNDPCKVVPFQSWCIDFVCIGCSQWLCLSLDNQINIPDQDQISGLRVIKLFFMLNSAETKIYPAHKC